MMDSLFLPRREEIPEQIGETVSLESELRFVDRELQLAEDLFNNVTENSLVDAAAYRIKTLHAYRDYLLRTARAEGVLLPVAT